MPTKKEALALVVFGTNLQSTVGVKFTRKQLAMMEFAPSMLYKLHL
jgi:hypothetical protein